MSYVAPYSIFKDIFFKICFTYEPRHEKTRFCMCQNKGQDQQYSKCYHCTDGDMPFLVMLVTVEAGRCLTGSETSKTDSTNQS